MSIKARHLWGAPLAPANCWPVSWTLTKPPTRSNHHDGHAPRILCYINGKRHVISINGFSTGDERLRYHCQMTGTKVVLVPKGIARLYHPAGRWCMMRWCISRSMLAFNISIQPHCTHLVTIEGINLGDALNPVQEAILEDMALNVATAPLKGHGACSHGQRLTRVAVRLPSKT